jgi:adenosylcobinamide-phosphate synthase
LTGWAPVAALGLALLLDAWLGEPRWLYRRVPHPVVLIGRSIEWLESLLYRPDRSAFRQRVAGMVLAGAVLITATTVGGLVTAACREWSWGWIVEGCLMSTLLAQRSLVDHVRAVAEGLDASLEAGRAAVSRIVGRDPKALDEAGVARAAVESLAENLSDGVVAPLFWGALFGLPGILGYKALNTLDSMIGHRTPRHVHLGWASARLDDLANLVPARLTGAMICLAAAVQRTAGPEDAWRTMWRDARHHRSPNAGWPEAAMAGALGLRLAGPRSYGGQLVQDAWMGNGRDELTRVDVDAALKLAWVTWCLAALLAAGLAIVES